jgi:hypothetical protein
MFYNIQAGSVLRQIKKKIKTHLLCCKCKTLSLKVFELFGSAVRNGTCYTSSECNSKGGTASGNCAAG